VFDLRRTGTQATSSCSLTYEQESRLDNSFEDEEAVSLIFSSYHAGLNHKSMLLGDAVLPGSSNLEMRTF
jgi:hypothetical protein